MIILKKYYENIVIYDMINKFNYTNIMQVPTLRKVIVHLTIKETLINPRAIYIGLFTLELITGQKAIYTKVKKSDYSFKIEKDMKIGCKVILRRAKMFFFLEKLLLLVFPSIKKFKGLKNNKNISSRGTFTFGLTNIFNFPEIRYYYSKFITLNRIGIDVSIVTSAQTSIERDMLLKSLGFLLIDN